jgi:acyl-CoA dehydrogenase
VDFELPEHTRAIKGLVRRLATDFCIPLERKLLAGEPVSDEEQAGLTKAAANVGLWGLNLSKEFGGAELSTLDNVVVTEENYRTLVPIEFGGDPLILQACVGEQRERFLQPVLRGEHRLAFAQTESSGGSDPGNQMRTTAVRDGDDWILNGSKVFISDVDRASFVVVMAVTDAGKRQHGGVSAFIVEKGSPGFEVVRFIPVIRAAAHDIGYRQYELLFNDCRVPHSQLLGEAGEGFALAQKFLGNVRLNMGTRGIGIADRCLEMMKVYAKERVLFGEPLAQKQAVQGMIVDSWIDVHTARLVAYEAATKNDEGLDIRMEAALVKLMGTEMVARVVDRAIQIHGGYGVTTELPFAFWYARVRQMRIVDGPSEVHKYQVLGRALLRS